MDPLDNLIPLRNNIAVIALAFFFSSPDDAKAFADGRIHKKGNVG